MVVEQFRRHNGRGTGGAAPGLAGRDSLPADDSATYHHPEGDRPDNHETFHGLSSLGSCEPRTRARRPSYARRQDVDFTDGVCPTVMRVWWTAGRVGARGPRLGFGQVLTRTGLVAARRLARGEH
jgi:hypothetical protein